jgi:hypothetical protein
MGVQEWQIQHIASLRLHQSFRDQKSQNLKQPHSMNLMIYQWILTLGRVRWRRTYLLVSASATNYTSQRRRYSGVSGAINSDDSKVVFPYGSKGKVGNKMGGVANELEVEQATSRYAIPESAMEI